MRPIRTVSVLMPTWQGIEFLDRVLAALASQRFDRPWDFLAIVKYPDNETAFRVLAKIAKLEVVETETFPAEDISVFMKALV